MPNPQIKENGAYVNTTPFQKSALGWHATKEIYQKVSGSWTSIYSLANDGVSNPLISSQVTTDRKLVVNFTIPAEPLEKVVVYTGMSIYSATPTDVVDGFQNTFKVYDGALLTPGVSNSITFPLEGGTVASNTTYYSMIWLRDIYGIWYPPIACQVRTGDTIPTGTTYEEITKVFTPTGYAVWTGSARSARSGSTITIRYPEAAMFSYGSEYADYVQANPGHEFLSADLSVSKVSTSPAQNLYQGVKNFATGAMVANYTDDPFSSNVTSHEIHRASSFHVNMSSAANCFTLTAAQGGTVGGGGGSSSLTGAWAPNSTTTKRAQLKVSYNVPSPTLGQTSITVTGSVTISARYSFYDVNNVFAWSGNLLGSGTTTKNIDVATDGSQVIHTFSKVVDLTSSNQGLTFSFSVKGIDYIGASVMTSVSGTVNIPAKVEHAPTSYYIPGTGKITAKFRKKNVTTGYPVVSSTPLTI